MEILDPILISFYRMTGFPVLNYFIGTLLLALLTVVVGEFTISIVYRINRSHLDKLNKQVEKMQRLSSEALERGDEESYKACNKVGNDAFGHLFFNKFGLAAASLWPIFIALAWMQGRFREIGLPIPWLGWEINYVFFFILCYILARILFGRLKPRLPYFRGVQKMLKAYDKNVVEPTGQP